MHARQKTKIIVDYSRNIYRNKNFKIILFLTTPIKIEPICFS